VVFEKGPKDAEACRVALGALRPTRRDGDFRWKSMGVSPFGT
jgi:hypothetical protein